jgi:hypothetical protein
MRSWKLGDGDPLQLTLSADARLDSADYTNDTTWELNFGKGDPAALAVQTTFGLRARWMQIFPCFTRLGKTRIDPSTFTRPPQVTRFFSNLIVLNFSPFEGIEVSAQYWAAGSQVLAGRIHMENKSILPHNIRLDLAGLLAPLGSGEGMAALPMGLSSALQGRSGNIAVVCCLGGSAQTGKTTYPALAVQTELYPGSAHTITWAVATAGEVDAAYELARATCNRPWEAEQARIELHASAAMPDIHTGLPDWDAAFALAQKTARGLILANPAQLQNASFVLARRPDYGASSRGDGSDHPALWKGQTAFDSFYLANLLLPGSPDLLRGLVQNFLTTQAEQGYADLRPGLGGQRGRMLVQPFLAGLALRAAPSPREDEWLAVMFSGLLQVFRSWLDEENDRDGDGLPEWSHPFQTAIDDHPLFDRWNGAAQGVDTTAVESPALGAMLYRECNALIQIARRAGHEDEVPWLSAQAAHLAACVEETWDRKATSYTYRDMLTHLSPSGRTLLEFSGPGSYAVRRKLRAAQRLILQINGQAQTTRVVSVSLRGLNDAGETIEEKISARDFTWVGGSGRITSHLCYLQVERLEIEGIQAEDQAILRTVDLNQLDISLLLPLWAGIPNPKRAAALVQQQILGGWLESFGLAFCPLGQRPDEIPNLACMALPWNALVVEGLLNYGFRREAAELFGRLMNAVTNNLKREHNFRQLYQANTGTGMGERDHLWGLPPLDLFLKIIGIEKITPEEIIVRDFNPFPWPVTVQYQRMTIVREGEKTILTLPGRQPLTLSGREPRRISI